MSGPLRVLHVHAGNLYGGIETILVTLVRCAALEPRLSHEFALCFEGRLAEELRSAGAPVHALGTVRASRPWTVLRARGRLRGVLAAGRYDVVLFHSAWSHALLAAAVPSPRPAVVFWLHGAIVEPGLLDQLARRARRPRLVIANSAYTLATAGALFRAARAEVFHQPLARPAEDTGSPARRELIRAEFGASVGDVVILHAGRMEAWKGHGDLLDALARIGDAAPWTCWFAGGAQRPSEARYAAALRARAAHLGLAQRVRFLGERRDLARVIAAADLYCQPNSAPEPFGNVFIEAMYAGLPVVTAAAGGPAEIVDETCGILTPLGNGAALEAALRSLLADAGRRRALGRGGPPRARQLCDPARQLAALATLLESAAGPVEPSPRQSLA